MKKSTQYICILMLMVLCTIPAIAQLENNGYYRFRNADRTSEYISFTNNLFDHVTIVDKAAGGFTNLSGSAGQARALTCASRYMQTDIHLVEDEEFIDVSTIVYVLKKTTNNGYDLIGQSTSLANLTTGTVSHPNSTGKPSLSFKDIYAYIQRSSGSGATTLYTAYITLKGTLTYFGMSSTQNLGDRYFIDREGVFDITEGNTTQNAKGYIEPIDHFNVKPTIALNGRFYTSIYVPFAFKLAGQVLKAYAITGINNDGTLNYEVAATTGGTVPAGTPVLLECGTDVVADCHKNALPLHDI